MMKTANENWFRRAKPDVFFEADDVILAIGQDNTFPWIERDIGVEFGEWEMPIVDKVTFQSTNPKVFFGGDAAFGPENVITAVAHGHQAAVSIHRVCSNEDVNDSSFAVRQSAQPENGHSRMGLRQRSRQRFAFYRAASR